MDTIYIKNCFIGVLLDYKSESRINSLLKNYASYNRSQILHLTIFFLGSLTEPEYLKILKEFVLNVPSQNGVRLTLPSETDTKISFFNKPDQKIYILKPAVHLKDLTRLNKFYRNLYLKYGITDDHKTYNPHITLFYSPKIPTQDSLTSELKGLINKLNVEFDVNNLYLMGKSVKDKYKKVNILSKIKLRDY